MAVFLSKKNKINFSQSSQALTKENRRTYAKLNNVKRILHLKENY
ncbi:hypothetical protein KF201_0323 [Lactococcus lactis subsp. lactis]|nr:hypothetical protein KF201_0323 [Lactococcus lactis subsp. lactis]